MSRPELLYPIFSDVTVLSGVGKRFKELFERLRGGRVVDLLFHLPVGLIDRRHMPPIPAMQHGQIVTTLVEVVGYNESSGGSRQVKVPFRVMCANNSGTMMLVFFNGQRDYIKRMLPIGEIKAISGKAERFNQQVQIMHPDYIVPEAELATIQTIESVYPLTAGISQKVMVKIMAQAIKRLPNLPEWIDPHLLSQNAWPTWYEAMICLHTPKDCVTFDPKHPARMRLAYDELLASQLSLKLARRYTKRQKGQSITSSGVLCDQLLAQLPFELTSGQQEIIEKIRQDLISSDRMLRLLQGDVGSGKTVIALMAMLMVTEAGKQVALMAPTEVLANQHFEWIQSMLELIGVRCVCLTGSVKGKRRKDILHQIETGEAQVVIGTHALFQDQVQFSELGFVVIDEQHRFGVNQRLALTHKGVYVDTLLMTATPIPRTLTLALYGDMDCSSLTEKPKGRLPIETTTISIKRSRDIVLGLQRVVSKKHRVYWICPLIEESEKVDLAAAEDRFSELKQQYGDQVGLVHGRMKSKEKDEVMLAFKEGRISILVSTTVVEVGVDVPEATVMIIEHAERFGLAQLHQLRGRVGRSDVQSQCVLLYEKLNDVSKQRLESMRKSNDGFFLAEEDLRLRGGGDILGTKQSGVPDFKIADLTEHYDLLKIAHQDAENIIVQDPELKSERGEALKHLLYLFDQDIGVRYLKVG